MLNKSKARIGKSMAQVAKKKFKEEPAKGDEFIKEAMNRLVQDNDKVLASVF